MAGKVPTTIEAVDQFFDALIKSRFIEMFGTPTQNEKHWPTEKMKEVAPAIHSDDLPKSEGNWLLNLDAIQSDSGEILFKNRVPEAELNGSIITFSSNHVLYSKLRPYLNKVVVPDESGFGTTELIPLLPNKEKLTRTYLAYLLRSDVFVSKFSSAVAGTKMPRVSMDVFWRFDVPLPSMNLQKEFESFVKQVDKSKMLMKKCFEKYDQLVKSRFIEMFGTHHSCYFPMANISELVETNIIKVSKKYRSEDEISYIDISSIDKDSRSVCTFSVFLVSDAPSRAQQCVESGDILMSTVRPNLCNIAIYDKNYENPVCSSGLCVLRPSKCVKEYLLYCVLDDDYTYELVKLATGSNYPAVTSKIILNTAVPNPPIELQKEFANFVKQIDKSKFALMESVMKVLNKA